MQPQRLPNVRLEARHEFRPGSVARVRAAVDDPTPDLVIILLKLSLDSVGFVVVGLYIGLSSREIADAMSAGANSSLQVDHCARERLRSGENGSTDN